MRTFGSIKACCESFSRVIENLEEEKSENAKRENWLQSNSEFFLGLKLASDLQVCFFPAKAQINRPSQHKQFSRYLKTCWALTSSPAQPSLDLAINGKRMFIRQLISARIHIIIYTYTNSIKPKIPLHFVIV